MDGFLNLCRSMWEQKAITEEMEKQLKAQKTILGKMQKDILAQMDALELDKQHIPGFGLIFTRTERSVQVPKTLEDKLKLFEWIEKNKGRDVLDNYLTINSRSLNSFYKAEYEIAKEEGNMNFAIAGIGKPEAYVKLAMRKG